MSTRRIVLLPLLVMLLLTILIGGTAYQQTSRWEHGVQEVSTNITQLLIRSYIQNELRTIQQELKQRPEQSLKNWQEVQQASRILSEMLQKNKDANPGYTDISQSTPVLPSSLQMIVNTSTPNTHKIDTILKSHYFQISLSELGELQTLQSSSRQVTIMVTLSMLVLGLLLTLVTARDLDRLFQQLARSRDLNIQLQEEERHRIAQELHDGTVQELIDLKRDYQPEKVDQLLHNLRRVCHNLKPQVLDDLGLPAAIEFLADDLRQAGIVQVNLYLDHDELSNLPKTYELPIFRVVQELCSNIKHHSAATQTNIRILYSPLESPLLRGYVNDNGRGFDAKAIPLDSMGLTGIKERIQQVGGQFKMESTLGKGSQFQWTIPIRPNL